MSRYFLELAYKGTAYHGWQIQPNGITVQEKLNDALAIILKQPVKTTGQGRTDTGVHASKFFAHFDFEGDIPERIIPALNGILPKDIVVYRCFPVTDEAHARFTCFRRTYEYHISTRRNPFDADFAFRFTKPLQLDEMRKAADILKGTHDFSSFCKGVDDLEVSTICKLDTADISAHEHKLILTFAADRFLRNMVRALTGTLLEVGTGVRTADSMQELLSAKSRSKAGISVPAQGLYLVNVEYPQTIYP